MTLDCERDLIASLLKLWPEISEGEVRPDHCILGTRVAIEVGEYFGFRWEPLAVDIVIFNEPGLKLFLDNVPVQDWPPEAHSVGCICADKLGASGWDGHVIAQSKAHLLDLSGAQFDRPERDIAMGPWTAPNPGEEGPWHVHNAEANMVIWPRPEITAYRRARDWRVNYKRHAARLIRELRGR